MATLTLLVGLPAAGKTTRARTLAAEQGALRLTPDEWMIPLFGDSDAGGRRDVVEGRLISVALAALAVGTDVILDFGCFARDERTALHALTRSVGACFVMEYLPVDFATQVARIAGRWSRAPESTFPMAAADVERWRRIFQVPDTAELSGPPGPPSPPWSGWPAWARHRWPSLETPGPDTPAEHMIDNAPTGD